MTLSGYDVSVWQRTTPSLAGKAFLFAKATEGMSSDPRYVMHMSNAASVVRGAYHFNSQNGNPRDQASHFLDVAGNVDLYALDVEGRTAFTRQQAMAFIDQVHRLGKSVGLYMSESSFMQAGQDWNWVAKWGQVPPSIAWHFWQWQGATLDRDVFNGDYETLGQLIGRTLAMATQAIITEVPALVDLAAGSALFDLDGKTKLATISLPLTNRASPYGVANNMRAVYATVGGQRRVVLVLPSSTAAPPASNVVVAQAQAVATERARLRTLLGL